MMACTTSTPMPSHVHECCLSHADINGVFVDLLFKREGVSSLSGGGRNLVVNNNVSRTKDSHCTGNQQEPLNTSQINSMLALASDEELCASSLATASPQHLLALLPRVENKLVALRVWSLVRAAKTTQGRLRAMCSETNECAIAEARKVQDENVADTVASIIRKVEGILFAVWTLDDASGVTEILSLSTEPNVSRLLCQVSVLTQLRGGYVNDGTGDVVVGILGATGAGKSSLFNALLLERSVLPTSGARACTASAVELGFNDKWAEDAAAAVAWGRAAEKAPYVCTVETISKETWKSECETLLGSLKRSQADNSILPPAASASSATKEAWDKVRSVYGTVLEPTELGEALEDSVGSTRVREATDRVRKALSRRFVVQAWTAEECRLKVLEYVDSPTDAANGAMWPLVSRVEVLGPWMSLACGVRLLDTPGIGDGNAARSEVVKGHLARADSVLLASNCRRGVDDAHIAKWLNADVKRLLAGADLCEEVPRGSLALCFTQTDILNVEEVVDNLRLKLDDNLSAAERARQCALARNDFVKTRALKSFRESSRIATGGNVDASGDKTWPLECFTVSAVDYQRLSGLRDAVQDGEHVFAELEETQVPMLQSWLVDTTKRIRNAWRKRSALRRMSLTHLSENVREALSIMRLSPASLTMGNLLLGAQALAAKRMQDEEDYAEGGVEKSSAGGGGASSSKKPWPARKSSNQRVPTMMERHLKKNQRAANAFLHLHKKYRNSTVLGNALSPPSSKKPRIDSSAIGTRVETVDLTGDDLTSLPKTSEPVVVDLTLN